MEMGIKKMLMRATPGKASTVAAVRAVQSAVSPSSNRQRALAKPATPWRGAGFQPARFGRPLAARMALTLRNTGQGCP